MKKQTIKNLKLQKRTISKITNQTVGGARYHTYTCANTVLLCPIDADTSDPLEPIPDEPTVFVLSLCFCLTEDC